MSESVRAVDRALDVLMCFSSQTPELTMTQIAEQVGIHKSTAHRLLATLENKRFIQRDPTTGIYRLGIRLLQMAYLTIEHNDLRRLAAPFMHQLCDMYEENIDLTVLDDTDVVFINILEGPKRVKLAAAIGQRLPAFATASGKAILGFMPAKTVRGILDRGMPQLTPYTLSAPDVLLKDLNSVKESGFALSEQELEEQINAVAAPIFNQEQHPIASIAVAGPAYRLTRQKMNEIGPNLVATAQAISREIAMTDIPPVNS
ncbi:MAG TPA: IclR family transcriptional regulator [Anaerolineales bacterium]|nr:IclR family transcriptional regulator [Anaerolineales bacterium]